ncbi:MAG: hypothetical protein HGA96_05950 [Desulfobulbaceae bacterium]|nr:hypothetical protein [Desulfobulbaceae bacterium]
MTKQKRQSYAESGALQELLHQALVGKRFTLQCGHRVSVGHQFSNTIVIRGNGKNQPLTLLCADCAD